MTLRSIVCPDAGSTTGSVMSVCMMGSRNSSGTSPISSSRCLALVAESVTVVTNTSKRMIASSDDAAVRVLRRSCAACTNTSWL